MLAAAISALPTQLLLLKWWEFLVSHIVLVSPRMNITWRSMVAATAAAADAAARWSSATLYTTITK